MTVSMNLSEVRQKDIERAQIEAATARFLAEKKRIESIPITDHKVADYHDFKLPGSPAGRKRK